MEMRMFNRPVTVLSTEGQHWETFGRGKRVKNIKRIRHRVMFEHLDTNWLVRPFREKQDANE
jgi:hypothetical protein